MSIRQIIFGVFGVLFPQLNNNNNSLVVSAQLLSLPLSCLGTGKKNNQLCWRKGQGRKETFERKISLGVMHWRKNSLRSSKTEALESGQKVHILKKKKRYF